MNANMKIATTANYRLHNVNTFLITMNTLIC